MFDKKFQVVIFIFTFNKYCDTLDNCFSTWQHSLHVIHVVHSKDWYYPHAAL